MDTIWHIIACVVGCLMLLLLGCLFLVFGWVGHVIVRVLTFGKVQLDWHEGGESYLTQLIGAFIVLAIGGLIAWLTHQ